MGRVERGGGFVEGWICTEVCLRSRLYSACSSVRVMDWMGGICEDVVVVQRCNIYSY